MSVRTAEAVTQAWERFEETLKRISPKTHATLLAGASDADIKEAESILEMTLAEDIKTFYRAHNGEEPTDEASDGVFDFAYFMPLAGKVDSAVSESLSWDELVKLPNIDEYKPRIKGRKFTWEMTLNWLTFAKDFAGNSLIVDCKTGEVILYDHESTIEMKIIAASLVEFLDQEREKLDSSPNKKPAKKKEADDDFDIDEEVADGKEEEEDEDADSDEEEEEEEEDDDLEDLDLDEEFFSDEDDADDDEDEDEDDKDDEDEDDGKSAAPPASHVRTLEDRPWLEVAVRLPAIRKRIPGTLIQTETMKAMDVTIEILDPKIVKDSHADPLRTVAVTVYSTSNPAETLLSGYGGDGELDRASFFRGEEMILPVGSGLFHDKIKKGSTASFPVLYWVAEHLDDEMGMFLELRRRQPR